MGKTNEWFLKYLSGEIAKRGYIFKEEDCFYQPHDTLNDVIRKIIFSPGNRLLYIDGENKKIKGILTLIDLFDYFIQYTEAETESILTLNNIV